MMQIRAGSISAFRSHDLGAWLSTIVFITTMVVVMLISHMGLAHGQGFDVRLGESHICTPASSVISNKPEVTGIAWSSDGKKIAGYSAFGTQVSIWNSNNCNLQSSFQIQDNRFIAPSITFLRNDDLVLTPANIQQSEDKKFSLSAWDASRAKVAFNYVGLGADNNTALNRPARFAIAKDQSVIASIASAYGSPIALYSVGGEQSPLSLSLPSNAKRDSAIAVAVAPQGDFVAVGTIGGRAIVFRSKPKSPPVYQLEVYPKTLQVGVGSISFSPNGSLLATGVQAVRTLWGDEKTNAPIKIWNLSDGRLQAEIGNHLISVVDMAWHPTGRILAVALSDHSLEFINVASAESRTEKLDNGPLYALQFNPAGDQLAVATGQGVVVFNLQL